MSWAQYCTNLATAGMKTNCVIGLNGQIYAQAGNAIKPEQAANLASRAKASDDRKRAEILYGNKKYMFLKESDNMIQGKEKPMGTPGGICIAWAKTVMLVGVYEEGMQGGQASVAVGKYRDHLRDNNC